MAKVFLTAVFVYQLTYWAWVKMETDEIQGERQGMGSKNERVRLSESAWRADARLGAAEIAGLEEQVKNLQASEKAR